MNKVVISIPFRMGKSWREKYFFEQKPQRYGYIRLGKDKEIEELYWEGDILMKMNQKTHQGELYHGTR